MIQSSFSAGQVVTEQGTAGGFVGFNFSEGTINNSQATGSNSVTSGGTAGGFAGENAGTIADSSSTRPVSVSTPTLADLTAGGFVGNNSGNITNSTASGPVTGTGELVSLGGFVGQNEGLINNSSSSGNVSGNGLFVTVGGFAAFNNEQAQILNSNTTGSVTATGEIVLAGGFAGASMGSINQSSATGNVNVGGATFAVAGGFAGINFGLIQHGSATGTVTGGDNSFVGGLVGFNLFGGISESYATGAVTGGPGSVAGGLVAINLGAIGTSSSTGPVNGGRRRHGRADWSAVNLGVGCRARPWQGCRPPRLVSDLNDIGTIRQSFSTSPVTGGPNSTVAGLVAANGGLLDQTYAIGLVQGGPGSTTRRTGRGQHCGLHDSPASVPGGDQLPQQGGTVTNSYWDQTATGQQISAAGSCSPTFPVCHPGSMPAVWLSCQAPFRVLARAACRDAAGRRCRRSTAIRRNESSHDPVRDILPPPATLVVANLTQQPNTNPTTQADWSSSRPRRSRRTQTSRAATSGRRATRAPTTARCGRTAARATFRRSPRRASSTTRWWCRSAPESRPTCSTASRGVSA